jgi:phenylpropionate dioxygenase-like ring-hydroxylating dioxygenase large terminal subunit
MGAVLRSYWLPVLYSHELEVDGAPQRVRLLGEDLVAFRDTDGQVGLVAENCPHRGASMFFGRNEESGLRCVYHGWKFDASGACVDMPNEPPESNFKHKVKIGSYPCVESAGAVWTYMGSQATPPPLPDTEFRSMPDNQRRWAWRGIRQCNWVQAMEGDLDTSHPYFLHGRVNPNDGPEYGFWHPDTAPRLFVLDTDYGVMYGSRRDEPGDTHYWRTSQFLMPCITMFPASPEGTVPGHYWVPMDDEHTLIWCFCWNPTEPYTEEELRGYSTKGEINELWEPNNGAGDMLSTQFGRPYPNSWAALNSSNDYGLDREVQRTKTYTGIPRIPLQDVAVTESMGRISERTRERLGTADSMIIRVRRRLINAARALRDEGVLPPGVEDPTVFRVRSCAAVLPKDADWVEALSDWHHARITHRLDSAVRTDRTGG